jgi:hypothetical protein
MPLNQSLTVIIISYPIRGAYRNPLSSRQETTVALTVKARKGINLLSILIPVLTVERRAIRHINVLRSLRILITLNELTPLLPPVIHRERTRITPL